MNPNRKGADNIDEERGEALRRGRGNKPCPVMGVIVLPPNEIEGVLTRSRLQKRKP